MSHDKPETQMVETYSDTGSTPVHSGTAKDGHHLAVDAEALGINEKAVLRKT